MNEFVKTSEVQQLLDRVSGQDMKNGDPRLKKIVRKIVQNLFETIDEFDISDDEFWTFMNFAIKGCDEYGLWAAGLGLEHFLDMRADAKDEAAGLAGGTPRTIEGPLYVAGAPTSEKSARLDDGTDKGALLVMHGQVRDANGGAIPHAQVEVWHANTAGNYSIFDKTQSPFNLRRTIITDENGRYEFRSIMPSGYGCSPEGSTSTILSSIGRHGRRPAHIHFFVSADRYRHLTTQINIDGDPYLNDDFAYATKDKLIPEVLEHEGGEPGAHLGITGHYNEIIFDFVMQPAEAEESENASVRMRAVG